LGWGIKNVKLCQFAVYENDTSPFGKGGSKGIFQVDGLLNPPWPPFFKGGNPFDFSILDDDDITALESENPLRIKRLLPELSRYGIARKVFDITK
jgi:hypothetical protein